jgi:hypothetical protein
LVVSSKAVPSDAWDSFVSKSRVSWPGDATWADRRTALAQKSFLNASGINGSRIPQAAATARVAPYPFVGFCREITFRSQQSLASRPLELRYAMRALHLRIAKNRRFGDWRAPIAGSRAPSRRRLCRLRSKIVVERLFGRPTACIILFPPGRSETCPAERYDAGWSSPVAREAHNLEVAGSNPVPAI